MSDGKQADVPETTANYTVKDAYDDAMVACGAGNIAKAKRLLAAIKLRLETGDTSLTRPRFTAR